MSEIGFLTLKAVGPLFAVKEIVAYPMNNKRHSLMSHQQVRPRSFGEHSVTDKIFIRLVGKSKT